MKLQLKHFSTKHNSFSKIFTRVFCNMSTRDNPFGMADKFRAGRVKVTEVRHGLFRILWDISHQMDESIEYYHEFELVGTMFGRGFLISAIHRYMDWDVTLKYLSSSDHSRYSSTQPAIHQPKSKRPKVEEESLPIELKTLPSVKLWILGKCEPVSEDYPGKWRLLALKTLVGEEPFVEFLIDYGTNEVNEKHLIDGLSEMFHNQTLCDIKFKFKNNEEIGAHVMILSARSPVFTVMLQSDFVESKTRIVDIADFEMEIFKEMLISMYTGKTPKVTDMNFTRSLYEVADKYCVEPLKKDCTNILVSQLRNYNAMELLVWAQFQSLTELFEKAMKYIVENCKELCFQPQWLDFMMNHPKLCLQINQKMAKFVFIDDGIESSYDSD